MSDVHFYDTATALPSDDYWYYSAFTLLMLMVFQGMLCRMRQNSLAMLRDMRRPAYHVFCFRQRQWVLVSTDTLVPGDVISLSVDLAIHSAAAAAAEQKRQQRRGAGGGSAAAAADIVIPCDAVIIRGGCVTNEAMLTGESVPQTKESIEWDAADEVVGVSREQENGSATGSGEGESGSRSSAREGNFIDLKGPDGSKWRRNVVFGGTNLLQHTSRGSANIDNSIISSGSSGARGSSQHAESSPVPPSPDHGCIAVVVRTGFATTQGNLMRKILFASERVVGDGDSIDTARFIAVLVCFAVVAAAYVLYHGLGDERRNQFRLILHCIMIITSVVPPELPMELSLAVTNSVATLSKGLVYCTEPFRLAYAGKLDVLCFD